MTHADSNSGCYQLLLRLDNPVGITIGALGKLSFTDGYYFYTGRAKRYLRQRIERHRRTDKIKRWHIDYLRERAELIQVFYFPDRFDECIINKHRAQTLRGAKIIRKFGSSDCRCQGHLIYAGREKPDYDPETVPG
ncbi:MAG: GIY-YIG nuclease family protein [candidate division Zixibacteria bacterium]|nr:GIY-YIG nuclease family protein [candidate division Zixibacteria bacterium]